jgi:hypothetical protein
MDRENISPTASGQSRKRKETSGLTEKEVVAVIDELAAHFSTAGRPRIRLFKSTLNLFRYQALGDQRFHVVEELRKRAARLTGMDNFVFYLDGLETELKLSILAQRQAEKKARGAATKVPRLVSGSASSGDSSAGAAAAPPDPTTAVEVETIDIAGIAGTIDSALVSRSGIFAQPSTESAPADLTLASILKTHEAAPFKIGITLPECSHHFINFIDHLSEALKFDPQILSNLLYVMSNKVLLNSIPHPSREFIHDSDLLSAELAIEALGLNPQYTQIRDHLNRLKNYPRAKSWLGRQVLPDIATQERKSEHIRESCLRQFKNAIENFTIQLEAKTYDPSVVYRYLYHLMSEMIAEIKRYNVMGGGSAAIALQMEEYQLTHMTAYPSEEESPIHSGEDTSTKLERTEP